MGSLHRSAKIHHRRLVAERYFHYRAKTNHLKKLHKLALGSFIGPMVATFFICLFVLLMQFLWKYIDYLAGKGLEWTVVAELLFYASAFLVPMAIPLSVLLSSIMTFGNLAEHYELLAFKTTGVSLLRVMYPLIILAFLISTGAFLFSNNVVPISNLRFKALLNDIKEQKPAMEIVEGVFYTGIDGYAIRVDKKDLETQDLFDIIIYDYTEGRGNVMVTRADEGKMYMTQDERFLILDLKNGIQYHEMDDRKGNSHLTHPHTRLSFDQYQIHFDLSSFDFKRSSSDLWKSGSQMLNLSQLRVYIDSTLEVHELKVKQLQKQVQPYFVNRYDSTFETKALTHLTLANDTLYAAGLTGFQPRTLIQRAQSNARSIRGSMRSAASEIKYQRHRRVRGQIEYHRKFTLSLVCLILFFIGAPLGAIIRKGGLGMPVVVSTVLFVLLYVLMIGGEKASKQYIISPEIGMWYPVFTIVPIAIILTYRANNDSKIVNFAGSLRSLFKRKRRS